MEYKECMKSPSKGGYSRKELNSIALSKGLDPKDYKKKENLCQELVKLNQNIVETSPKEKKVNKPSPKKIIKKPSPKKIIKKPSPKKIVKKPSPKKIVKKPSPKKIVNKPSPKKIIKKPSPKKIIKKPSLKKIVNKPSPKKIVKKPSPKKIIKNPSPKKIVKNPSPKKIVKKPNQKLENQKIMKVDKKLEQKTKLDKEKYSSEYSEIKEIGILDPNGLHNNPFNNLPYSDNYKKLSSMWSKLPAYKDRKEIVNNIIKNQVILIESNTGSGKSVLIPKYALHSLDYKGNVIMVLPKRDITISTATFSANTLDVELGNFVGYKIKGDSKFSKNTKILYATDGTLVSKINEDPLLLEYDIFIIDEAHERKVQTDLLLYLLKQVLYERPKCKLIIMSATIDVELFKNYYKDFSFSHMMLSGETNYPVESIFLNSPLSYELAFSKGFEYLLKILSEIDKLPQKERLEYQDIIFFVTSQNEAFMMCQRLHKVMNSENRFKCNITCNNKILCLELFSGVNENKKKLALNKEYRNDGYTIKVIFSTNVAESSLTISTVKYVIDTGYEYKNSYSPKFRASRLDRVMITQSQAIQRKGRAGRTSPGICYHLYTLDQFENMEKFPEPAIKNSNIFSESLSILSLPKIQNLSSLNMVLNNLIQPPKNDYIKNAIKMIKEKGLVTNDKINLLGNSILGLVDDPLDGLSLVFANLLDCVDEVLKIILLCSNIKDRISPIFVTFDIPDDIKENLARKYGDHLTLLGIFNTFINLKGENLKKWGQKNFLKLNVLEKTYIEYNRIYNFIYNKLSKLDYNKLIDLLDIEIDKLNKLSIEDKIIYCFAKSQNIAEYKKRGYETDFLNSINLKIDKDSFLNNEPYKLVYKKNFISNNQCYLQITSELPKNVQKMLD